MPRKNIYVKDADIEIFERAEQLDGESISVIIADTLRKFVAQKEAEAAGYQEHILEVGTANEDTRKVKFIGRLLADGRKFTGQTSDRRDRGEDWQIYQTRAGKIIVYLDQWSQWDGERNRMQHVVMTELPGYEDKAFEGCGCHVPGDILQEAHEAIGREMVEYVE